MRLADFIEQNVGRIVQGAEAFSRSQMPVGAQLSATALRNHIPEILLAIVHDLRTAQSAVQQRRKSEGRAPKPPGSESAASSHGRMRATDGFDVNQMVAEYRALRAAVLRLWSADKALTEDSIDDMVRFNEAIDQAIAESLDEYTREVESWRQKFLGVLGHDLRGPLSVIVGTADLLSASTGQTPYRRQVERISSSSLRIARLLEDLLEYSKSKLGVGMTIHPENCDLGEQLAEEVDLLRAEFPQVDIRFHAEGTTRGRFDASRLREAIHNLVTNAAKYGDTDEAVHVLLTDDIDRVLISVSNMGAPLSAEQMRLMFDPLRRGADEAAYGEDASLGLGLFIVREIVNAHQGQVAVACTEGKTMFTLSLPRQREA